MGKKALVFWFFFLIFFGLGWVAHGFFLAAQANEKEKEENADR